MWKPLVVKNQGDSLVFWLNQHLCGNVKYSHVPRLCLVKKEIPSHHLWDCTWHEYYLCNWSTKFTLRMYIVYSKCMRELGKSTFLLPMLIEMVITFSSIGIGWIHYGVFNPSLWSPIFCGTCAFTKVYYFVIGWYLFCLSFNFWWWLMWFDYIIHVMCVLLPTNSTNKLLDVIFFSISAIWST